MLSKQHYYDIIFFSLFLVSFGTNVVYNEVTITGLVWLSLWYLMPLSIIFQLYRGGQFYCGGNRSTLRKPATCRKSLTNFIT